MNHTTKTTMEHNDAPHKEVQSVPFIMFLNMVKGMTIGLLLLVTFTCTAQKSSYYEPLDSYFAGDDAGSFGDRNTFVGAHSGSSTYSLADDNTFLGAYSGGSNYGGFSNTFMGAESGSKLYVGDHNVLIGARAGTTIVEGRNNVMVGGASGRYLGSFSDNVFLGASSGYLAEGNGNLFLGMHSGHNAKGDHNVFLGASSGYSAEGSNLLYIENSDSNEPLIWGDFSSDIVNINGKFGVGTTNPEGELDVYGDAFFREDGSNYLRMGHGGSNARIDFKGAGNLDFRYANTDLMTLHQSGKLGIGTTNPEQMLDVRGGGIFEDLEVGKDLTTNSLSVSQNVEVGNDLTISNSLNVENSLQVSNELSAGTISSLGAVTIGSAASNEVLKLYGTAQVKELHMDPTGNWSDFVFEKDYQLRPLNEVATFIEENNHLPDVPSAQQVSEEGYNQTEVNALLLQKIEELTLYMIDLKNQNDALVKELNAISSDLK